MTFSRSEDSMSSGRGIKGERARRRRSLGVGTPGLRGGVVDIIGDEDREDVDFVLLEPLVDSLPTGLEVTTLRTP